jgi:Pyruvate/2-oxoacid:ferredoxin oxidoreductase delta subunit
MPAKYHISTKTAPPVHKLIGKYGIVDWREDCSACHNCVKRECAYSVYNDERDRLHKSGEYVDYLYECKGCLCCVQSCTKNLLTWEENPEYAALGDEVWTPDIISSTWYQAETGKIPVSGAGYPGRFRGPGFDSILTDMSEIVRPTRDGIHGREYISTSVDIGRKPLNLEFDASGKLLTECPTIVESPLPIIFNMMPWHWVSPKITEAIVSAAEKLGTFAVTNEPKLMSRPGAIPHIPEQASNAPAEAAKIAQWSDGPGVVERISAAKQVNPDLVAVVKLSFGPEAASRALELAKQGVDAVHLAADWRGYVDNKHITMWVRDVHKAVVDAGLRDGVTLIASGGISLAEHVIKTILCGADLVAIDVPLMIALECRVCGNCREGLECPQTMDDLGRDYAIQRMVNLMGAWHSQLLEMMGAMGIREARRLRGEVGRAMFFDDLERDCFGPIFGRRKTEVA